MQFSRNEETLIHLMYYIFLIMKQLPISIMVVIYVDCLHNNDQKIFNKLVNIMVYIFQINDCNFMKKTY